MNSESREKRSRNKLMEILSDTKLTDYEKIRNFPVFTPGFVLSRFVAHYELFKKIVDVPGVIIDLGVYRGSSFFTWAKLCEIFHPNDVQRKVYGFDTFEGFPSISEKDGSGHEAKKIAGGYSSGSGIYEYLYKAIEVMDIAGKINDVSRLRLIKGDVCQTIPKFIKDLEGGVGIALLNLDLDIYKPTKVALDHFMPFMAPGGIVVLDEYGVAEWPGESKAVAEWFEQNRDCRPKFEKFSWSSSPAAYFVINW